MQSKIKAIHALSVPVLSRLSTALAFWSSWVCKVREGLQIFFRIEHSACILEFLGP